MGEDYLIINRPGRPGISSIGDWNKSAIEFELHQLIITSISWIKAPSADFELQQLTLSSIRQFHRHCTDTWDHTIIVSQSGIELHSQIKMAVTYKLVTQLIKGISPHILRFMDDCLTVSIASSNRWYDYLYIFLKGEGDLANNKTRFPILTAFFELESPNLVRLASVARDLISPNIFYPTDFFSHKGEKKVKFSTSS